VAEEEIKTNISFDVTIKLTESKQFKTNINVDLPVEGVIENGKSSKEMEGKDFVFKRVEN